MLAPLRRVVCLVVGLLCAVSACSSSDRPETVDNPLEGVPEASAGPGRISGTLATGSEAALSGAFDGADASGRGQVRSELHTADGKTVPLEVRWLDGRVYIRRSSEPGTVTGLAGQLLNADPSKAGWTQASSNAYGSRLVNVFVPGALATELSNATDVKTTPGPEVDGAATTRYAAKRTAGLTFFWAGASTTTLLVDSERRVRRVTLTSGENAIEYDVTYGDEPVDVQAPSASDLAAPPTTRVVIEPTGEFTTVRSGTDLGQQWTLQRAPGSRGTTCWKLTANPPLAVQAPNVGSDTRCLAPPDPDDERPEQALFVLTTDGARDHAVVAVVPPPGATEANLGFTDGRRETVPVTDDALVVVYESETPLAFVGFTGGGSGVDCGVGAVSHIGDIVDESLSGGGFGVPWSCVDAEE